MYGAQEAFGQGHFPQTLPENHFTGIHGFREKFGGPPGPPWWMPIGPLWATGLYNSRWTRLGGPVLVSVYNLCAVCTALQRGPVEMNPKRRCQSPHRCRPQRRCQCRCQLSVGQWWSIHCPWPTMSGSQCLVPGLVPGPSPIPVRSLVPVLVPSSHGPGPMGPFPWSHGSGPGPMGPVPWSHGPGPTGPGPGAQGPSELIIKSLYILFLVSYLIQIY